MRKTMQKNDAIFPMPVLMVATYNDDGSVNVMNAAWGMMITRSVITLNLSEHHKTVQNIKARGAFTVSLADAAHLVEADYFGLVSGKEVPDKLGASGLTATKSEHVDAPVINEFPLCMECEYLAYDGGEYGSGVIGKVVCTTAEESVVSGDAVDAAKLSAIAFDPYTRGYYKVGERIGEAYHDGKAIAEKDA